MLKSNGNVGGILDNPRVGARIAGGALLLMAIVAAVCNFGIIESIVVRGDAAATAENIMASAGRFRLGATGLMMVVLLDIVVGWSFYLTFRTEKQSLALLMALLRVVYAAMFGTAIFELFRAESMAAHDASLTLFHVESFDKSWQVAMVIFGVHLAVLASLVWRRGVFSRVMAVLLAITAAGYLIDSFGTLLSSAYSLELSLYTFVGEVLLIVWLFVLGGKSLQSD